MTAFDHAASLHRNPLPDVPNTTDSDTILYHYATPNGLLGIVASASLWATDLRFFNDAAEYRYAVEQAGHALRRMAYGDGSESEAEVGRFAVSLPASPARPIYVASLTRRGNLLSQWRAYCPRGGYSIGFERVAIADLANQQGYELHECEYVAVSLLGARIEPEAHSGALMAAASELTVAWNALTAYPDPIRPGRADPERWNHATRAPAADRFLEALHQIAPALKDPAFREEVEVRLVAYDDGPPTALRFRGAVGGLTPYREFGLVRPGDDRLPIRSIMVGPAPDEDAAVRALERFIASEPRLAGVAALSSGIPLRY